MPHANTNPSPAIDLQQISTRNAHARNIIAGFASVLPELAGWWQALTDALSDTVALSAQLTRLSGELERARLDRANLRAAMRATLAAHADDEPDPLWYLRDELDGPKSPADASRRPK
jgi:hypothetical protein